MSVEALSVMGELSPYLILDGHRTGIQSDNMMHGYMEVAAFSLRFAAIFKKLGGRQVGSRMRKNIPEYNIRKTGDISLLTFA